MKQGLLAFVLTLSLSACTPGLSPDIGGAAERAASRAVETAVESAVDTLVQRTVDRIVNHLFDLVLASAIDGIFGANAFGVNSFGVNSTVEYGPDFALELYTGRYAVTLSGDTPLAGTYSFEGGEPGEDQETFDLGVGLRIQNDEGQEITNVNLIHTDEANGFILTLVEGRDESGTPVWQAGLQFDDEDVIYLGETTLEARESSSTRFAGSFSTELAVYEEGATPADGSRAVLRAVGVAATFDVPINPAGSLFVQQAQTAQAE